MPRVISATWKRTDVEKDWLSAMKARCKWISHQNGTAFLTGLLDFCSVIHSFWTWQQVDEAESAARSLRTAKLAQEVGVTSGFYNHPFTLRAARRASFGTRGGSDGAERTGGICIIS
jgi:hypothetical protein